MASYLTINQWIALSFAVPTLLIGFLGNMLVVILVSKKKRNQTPHDVFIFNLAVADFLSVTTTIPSEIAAYFGLLSHSTFYCRCVWPTMTASFVAGIFHITSMAIQRCRVITNPWRSKMKRRGAIIWAAINWLCALIVTLPLIIVVRPKKDTCYEDWPTANHRKAYTAALVALQYVLPLLITAGCYVRIGLFLQHSVVQRTGVNGRGEVVQRDNRRENKEIFKILSVIVISFTVSMLPLQVTWMLLEFGNFQDEAWLATLFWFSNILAMVHTCINPIIYGAVSKQVRREYVIYLTSLFCQRRPVVVSTEQGRQQGMWTRQPRSEAAKNAKKRCSFSSVTWLWNIVLSTPSWHNHHSK